MKLKLPKTQPRKVQISVVHNRDPLRERSFKETISGLTRLFESAGFSVRQSEMWFQGSVVAPARLVDVLSEYRYNSIIDGFRKLRGEKSRRLRKWERTFSILGHWLLRKNLPKANRVRKLISHKHLLAIDTFLNSNDDFLLVIEDDAVWDPLIGEPVFQKALMPLLDDCGAQTDDLFVNLTVGNGSELPNYALELGTQLVSGARRVYPGQPDTVCAYLMNRHTAENLARKYADDPVLKLVVPDVAWQNMFPKLNLSSIHLSPPLVLHGTASGSFASWN